MSIRQLKAFLYLIPAIVMSACGGGGNGSSTSNDGSSNQQNVTLALQLVASGLSGPTYLTAPSGDDRLFIVERSGKIRIVQGGALLDTPFLDLSDRISTDGERGLLSMAFDPKYTENGYFYVFYTNAGGNIIVDRFTVSGGNPDEADQTSGQQVISILHPTFNNHYGGQLAFGPDGMLYISTGDGGGEGDQTGNAQNTNVLLGKLLRVDVSDATMVVPYTIPQDNPFAFQTGKQQEIWAYGLRNPWRFSFDTVQNLLYLPDVGQDKVEEINVAGVSQAGLNYGWNIMEGTLCYAAETCDTQGLTMPVLEYEHGANDSNGCAVIGGYVYRGSAIPELQGQYIYSDLCTGGLKGFLYRTGNQSEWSIPSLTSVYSFGQDGRNELYVLSGTGDVFRIVGQ